MEDLLKKHCQSYTQEDSSLSHENILEYEELVVNWNVIENEKLEREFSFKDFKKAIEFINEVARISESENHHPDILLHGWNKIKVSLKTHAVNGLTENDFILAAKINEVYD